MSDDTHPMLCPECSAIGEFGCVLDLDETNVIGWRGECGHFIDYAEGWTMVHQTVSINGVSAIQVSFERR